MNNFSKCYIQKTFRLENILCLINKLMRMGVLDEYEVFSVSQTENRLRKYEETGFSFKGQGKTKS